MKKLIFAIAALASAALFAATAVTLRPGENPVPVGEIAALEAVTTNAAPSIKVDYVVSVRSYTNVLAQSFAYTNISGVAVLVTNTFPVRVPGPVFYKTNSVFSASASGHYLMATNPAVRFVSGRGKLVVSGASADDTITLFVE